MEPPLTCLLQSMLRVGLVVCEHKSCSISTWFPSLRRPWNTYHVYKYILNIRVFEKVTIENRCTYLKAKLMQFKEYCVCVKWYSFVMSHHTMPVVIVAPTLRYKSCRIVWQTCYTSCQLYFSFPIHFNFVILSRTLLYPGKWLNTCAHVKSPSFFSHYITCFNIERIQHIIQATRSHSSHCHHYHYCWHRVIL